VQVRVVGLSVCTYFDTERSLPQAASRPRYPKCAQIDALNNCRSSAMPSHPLPRDLHRALDRLQAEPDRLWTLASLAAACGVAPRTLQKHFRRYLGRTPLELVRELRLDQARQQLLRPAATTTVTDVAARCGFNHLGRFAAWYQRRYGQ
jgi:AraC-like DNA-binding protein